MIIILVKNHNLSLALDNQAVKSLSIQLIKQLNQLSLQLWAHCLYSNVSFYRQHWAFVCLSRQSAYFSLSAKFSLCYFFSWESWLDLFLCVKILIRSDTINHYFILYHVLLRNFFSLYFASFILHCKSHDTQIEQSLMNS